jgi:hypothetical protein
VVANNATVVDVKHMGDIPLRMEKNVYLRDVATIQDDIDITYGYALARIIHTHSSIGRSWWRRAAGAARRDTRRGPTPTPCSFSQRCAGPLLGLKWGRV